MYSLCATHTHKKERSFQDWSLESINYYHNNSIIRSQQLGRGTYQTVIRDTLNEMWWCPLLDYCDPSSFLGDSLFAQLPSQRETYYTHTHTPTQMMKNVPESRDVQSWDGIETRRWQVPREAWKLEMEKQKRSRMAKSKLKTVTSSRLLNDECLMW